MLQPIIFAIVTIAAISLAWKNYSKIRRNILLGKEDPAASPTGAGGTGNAGERWRNVLLIAFGQQKMFKRPLAALFHFFIYAAFLLTQIELIEIFVDGFTGSHRIFAAPLGGFYTFLIGFIEILSLLAFVATFIFLARRNLLKVPRLSMSELNGWPKLDANLILLGEILLLIGIFSMNGADKVLQGMGAEHYHPTGAFAVSSWLGPALFGGMGEGALMGLERFGWWLHILVVFAFLNYLPISKHLHILLAFPNTFYAKLTPKGQMTNMPDIQKEVASMMNPEAAAEPPAEGEMDLSFGANDVFKLSWKNLLDAYTCTECGRCTAVCPANITGKKLSPRKIMMDTRDRAEEIGKNLDSGEVKFIAEDKRAEGAVLTKENYHDGKSLFDYISREEIHACTTCNACVEACPVMIDPLNIILQLRRHEILMESAGPSDWLPLFNSMENSQAAWAVSTERDAWKAQL
ncbi:MAG: (Fe-S)-binding protein [Lewinellaceae bacterium]|nr:(Fe-S)-binding protein [Saprospiraceae bacterium]MCB9339458.1 (Fe-S)-binding protein [Lewinellaceae bacterium]